MNAMQPSIPRLPLARRLLIVEDDYALQQMLRWDFEDLGYEVTAVGSCHKARSAMCSIRFDLALLDYHLPDGDGIELVEALQRLDPAIPIVVSSGLPSPGLPARAAGGRFVFVTKPVTATKLDRAFRQALGCGSDAG